MHASQELCSCIVSGFASFPMSYINMTEDLHVDMGWRVLYQPDGLTGADTRDKIPSLVWQTLCIPMFQCRPIDFIGDITIQPFLFQNPGIASVGYTTLSPVMAEGCTQDNFLPSEVRSSRTLALSHTLSIHCLSILHTDRTGVWHSEQFSTTKYSPQLSIHGLYPWYWYRT